MMLQLWRRRISVSLWALQAHKLLSRLLVLFFWMITSALSSLQSNTVVISLTVLENSCNSNWLSTSSPFLWLFWVQLFWRDHPWHPFRCCGSTWLWIHSLPSPWPLNHPQINCWKECPIQENNILLLPKCGEVLSSMLSTNASFWPSFYSKEIRSSELRTSQM